LAFRLASILSFNINDLRFRKWAETRNWIFASICLLRPLAHKAFHTQSTVTRFKWVSGFHSIGWIKHSRVTYI